MFCHFFFRFLGIKNIALSSKLYDKFHKTGTCKHCEVVDLTSTCTLINLPTFVASLLIAKTTAVKGKFQWYSSTVKMSILAFCENKKKLREKNSTLMFKKKPICYINCYFIYIQHLTTTCYNYGPVYNYKFSVGRRNVDFCLFTNLKICITSCINIVCQLLIR